MLGGVGQLHGGGLGFLRAGGDLHRGVVNRGHQGTQLLDREVDRVRDRAGHVLGHGRLHGQVAFRERAHLVQQAHDRLLVAVVELLGGLVAQPVGTPQRPDQAGQGGQGQQAGQDAHPDATDDAGVLQRTEGGERREQVLAVRQQLVGTGRERFGGTLRLDQVARAGHDRVQVRLHALPEREGLVQRTDRAGGGDLGDVGAAIAQRVHRTIEHRGVAAQRAGRDLRAGTACPQFGDAAGHGRRGHHLLQRGEHLAGAGATRGQAADDFVQLRLQLGHLCGEAVGLACEPEHGLLRTGDLVGALGQRIPRGADGADRPGHAHFVAEAFVEGLDVRVDFRLRRLERFECRGIATDRFAPLVREALGIQLQARGRGAGATESRCLGRGIQGIAREHHQRPHQQRDPRIGAEVAALAGDGIHQSAHVATSGLRSWPRITRRLGGIRGCGSGARG